MPCSTAAFGSSSSFDKPPVELGGIACHIEASVSNVYCRAFGLVPWP